MTKYISLLRGINVSGHRKILMKDLKALYEKFGYINVITYIQSGNVIFESATDNSDKIRNNLEQAITKNYDFSVDILVLSVTEFIRVLEKLPFKNFDLEKDGTKIIVTFLSDNPDSLCLEKMMTYAAPNEEMIPGNKALYFRFPDGYGKTKLTNVLMERKLKVSTTSRNLKTVVKLVELAKG